MSTSNCNPPCSYLPTFNFSVMIFLSWAFNEIDDQAPIFSCSWKNNYFISVVAFNRNKKFAPRSTLFFLLWDSCALMFLLYILTTLKIFLMASQGWPQKALHGSLSAGGAFDSTLTASNFQRSDRAFIYQPQMLQYNQYLWGKNVQILVFQNKHHFDLKLSGSAIWTTSNRKI